jgi:hypothetical protein
MMMNRPAIFALTVGVALTWLLSPNSVGAETGNSSSPIGKPFRISKSVDQYCAVKPIVTMCEEFRPLLADFLAESRDAEWASSVEALIAKSMEMNGKPWVQIRALECRHTLCALEYAVSSDDLGRIADGDTQLDRLMEPIGGVMAPELASRSGKGTMVSVLIWRRRS